MTEDQKMILAIIFFACSLIGLLVVFIYQKKVVRKEKEVINSLEEETYKYYQELTLLEDKYFPYFSTHAAGIRRKSKSNGDKDNLTNVSIGKNRIFYFDRILYIVNNQMRYPIKKEIIDNKEYMVIDDKIKTIELLVSFEKPSNFLVKYNVKKLGKNKYELEWEKVVSEDDTRGNENN